jgi:hypothetical protein
MNHWPRRLFALAAPLLLTGCLWGPGKFASDLTLKKDGSFALDYRGEIVLQLPPDQESEPWADTKAKCSEAGKARPCTRDEIAEQRAAYEKKLEDGKEVAKLFGLPGLDDKSSRAFAAKLMKYAGWRSVAYRGNGVFDVDYHFEGRATQDFLFPALPDNDLIIPFIAIRRRADGSVLVTAPAMTGGAGPLAARAEAAAAQGMKAGPVSRAEGRFTIVTDGEILTNNSEDGPKPNAAGRELHWDVGPGSKKIPETLIRL